MDLQTTYMGLDLAHPIVASAGPLSKDLDGIKRLEDGGAAAIVMFSLFEEQIQREADAIERITNHGANSFGESLDYFPAAVSTLEVGPDRYLDLLRRARESVRVPVIASLNGMSERGWTHYARLLEEAGASAIELNVYWIPADLEHTSQQVEQRYFDVLAAVKAQVKVPVAMKLSPFFSAFGNFARRLAAAGADGLVLFNRFYQPDLDIERRTVVPTLRLSAPEELRLPLLWLSTLHGQLAASLAASTGVETAVEVIKYLMAGADITMTTSSLLRHGPTHVRTLRKGLEDWMAAHNYTSLTTLRGSMSRARVSDPGAFERANYVQLLEAWRPR